MKLKDNRCQFILLREFHINLNSSNSNMHGSHPNRVINQAQQPLLSEGFIPFLLGYPV
jgi:hypothetical protein